MSKNKKTYAATTQPAAKTSNPAMFKEKMIFTLAIILVAAIALTGTLIYVNYEVPVYTEISNTKPTTESSTATVKNGGFDFAVNKGEVGVPYVAQDWRTTKEGTASTIMGVLPTDAENWDGIMAQLKALGVKDITENPGTPDSQHKNDDVDENSIYMISNVSQTYASIRNSSSFSVAANSYNKLSVWVKTINAGDDAYIWVRKSVSNKAVEEECFMSVNTNGEWMEFCFYIEGKDSGSQSLYVDIGLGQNENSGYDNAQGTILIDDIVLSSYTKGDYLLKKDEGMTATQRVISFHESADAENIAVLNQSAEFETISSAQYCEDEEAKFPFSTESVDVYKLTNDGSTKSRGGSLIEKFHVTAPSTNTHYRLTFYIRTVDVAVHQGVNIYLYDANDKTNTTSTVHFAKQRTTGDVETDNLNGWVQYSFYIKPSNNKDFDLQLEFWLGSMLNGESLEEAVTGTLYVTELSLTEIKLSDYTLANANDKTKKVDLSSATFSPAGSFAIANGAFDTINSAPSYSRYPYAPADWTAAALFSAQDNDATYGIVSKGHVKNAELGITDADFAVETTDAESLLYIKNNNLVSFGLMSKALILAENTFYRISVVAKELEGGKANVYITGDINMSISMAEALAGTAYSSDKVTLADGFVQFNFYIATGDNSKTIRLNLFNGIMNPKSDEEKSQGIVLFDLANYVEMTEEKFANLSKSDLEDNEQVFESYTLVDENGKEITSFAPTSLFSNVKGLDLSMEKVEKKEGAPVINEDVDLDNNPIPVNWVTLLVSGASLIMLIALVVVFVIIFKRNKNIVTKTH